MTETNENNPADNMEHEGNAANDMPYKDDTSDGTTAKTPQEIAEETADQVRSSDQLARAEAGIPDPEEGHDVRDYRTYEQPDAGQAPANVGDDEAVDEHGNDVDTAADKGE